MKAAILALAAVGLMLAGGCGASALGVQADLVALGGITAAESDRLIVSTRRGELEAVKNAARAECGADGCDEARATFHREALARVFSKWAPVLACRPAVVEALRGWADGIELARHAATADLGLSHALILGLRFVSAYRALVECVEEAVPDLDLPGLPSAFGGEP